MTKGLAHNDCWIPSHDGVRLYAADTPALRGAKMPLLCLAGLTRDSRDFATLITHIHGDRRVIALDYRGRGRSAPAVDPASYTVEVEGLDVITVMDALNISRAAVIGTSRGGLIGFWMAHHHRPRLGGLLLNDIGPEIAVESLLRIRNYIGVEPRFQNFQQAAAFFSNQPGGVEGLSLKQWEDFARRTFRDDMGGLSLSYDARLAEAFPSAQDIATNLTGPLLWPVFESLAGLPLAALRGANSDLLTAETFADMKRRVPGMLSATVPGRAHVPFLDEPESLNLIGTWLKAIDGAA